MTVTARFETERASRYLQQLCKHFAHKVPAEFDAHHGEIALPLGSCVLDADETALTIVCDASDPAREPLLVKVVEVHLERFAWKEKVTLDWQRDGATAADLMTKLRAMPDPHKQTD